MDEHPTRFDDLNRWLNRRLEEASRGRDLGRKVMPGDHAAGAPGLPVDAALQDGGVPLDRLQSPQRGRVEPAGPDGGDADPVAEPSDAVTR